MVVCVDVFGCEYGVVLLIVDGGMVVFFLMVGLIWGSCVLRFLICLWL